MDKKKTFAIICFIGFIFFFILPVTLWVMFIKNFQQKIVLNKDVLFFTPTFAGLLYSSLIMVFIGILIGILFIAVINFKSPEHLRILTPKSKDIANLRKILLITAIISIPILILCSYNYYYIESNNLYYNSFFTFSEKNISLNNLEKIRAGLWTSNIKNHRATSINYEYILILKNGKKYNLKEAGFEKIIEIDNYFQSTNIPKEISILQEEALQYIQEKWNPEWNQAMRKILEID